MGDTQDFEERLPHLSNDELRSLARSGDFPKDLHAREALAAELHRRAKEAQPQETPPTIVGVDALSPEELSFELSLGARFVVFDYCISLLVITFRNASAVYFVRADERPLARGLKYTALSLLLGWWGIPWAPIYTVSSVARNFRGGRDVTAEVLASPWLEESHAA